MSLHADLVFRGGAVFTGRRAAYHTAVVNSKAMQVLGIGDRDPDPPGGEMERRDGVVTGVLKELAYMNHADTVGYGEDDMVEGVRLAAEDFVRRGITSVHDAGGAQAKNVRALQMAVESGACPIRRGGDDRYRRSGRLRKRRGVRRRGAPGGSAGGALAARARPFTGTARRGFPCGLQSPRRRSPGT